MSALPVLDAAGRRRSPATQPGFHAGESVASFFCNLVFFFVDEDFEGSLDGLH